jgi:hypothetical protein
MAFCAIGKLVRCLNIRGSHGDVCVCVSIAVGCGYPIGDRFKWGKNKKNRFIFPPPLLESDLFPVGGGKLVTVL